MRRHSLCLTIISSALLAASCADTGGPSATTGDTISSIGGGGDGGAGGSVPKAAYHLVGRFDESDPARPKSSWSGTTFRSRVSGSALSVSLGGAANVIFEVEIDGQATGTFTTTGGDVKYDVASGLSDGEHEIVLVRRNEGFFGDIEFLGFEPGPGASLVETAWPYAHAIEVIGDSLSAGYGIEGTSPACTFSGPTESFYGTYGAVAGRKLNAAVHGIVWSGKGILQNYGGGKDETMPAVWPRTLSGNPAEQWDFSKFVPDAVVLNLGTNDFSAPITEGDFVTAYVQFLDAVRAAHPSAMIFCVTWDGWGPMHEAWVQEAITMSGDPKLRHVGFVIDQTDGWGCDSHTNLVTNGKLGNVLAKAMDDELGW